MDILQSFKSIYLLEANWLFQILASRNKVPMNNWTQVWIKSFIYLGWKSLGVEILDHRVGIYPTLKKKLPNCLQIGLSFTFHKQL